MRRWYGIVGGVAALCVAGCTDPSAPAPSAQPTAVESEALSAEAPIASASATAGSEVGALSANKPPAPVSASTPDLSEANGDIRAGSGGALPGLGGGPRGPAFAIGGKFAKDLTTADLDAALGRAGCTTTRLDSPYSPSAAPSVALFEAKCSTHTFNVTFVPAGATLPEAKVIADMDRNGATWSDSGMLLAIMPKEKDSRPAAVELMNKLRSTDSGGISVTGSKGQASIGGASVSGGSVSNAGAVVAGMAAGFRRCYNRGLTEDPKMKGSVRITAKIGPNGEVLSASPSGGGGLSTTVTSCVAGVVSSRQFAPPDGGSATLVIPVSFIPVQ